MTTILHISASIRGAESISRSLSSSLVANLRESLGLDEPPVSRYF